MSAGRDGHGRAMANTTSMARVLIVAEERLGRRVAWVLEDAGHSIKLTHSAGEGLAEARAIRPDVVVINSVVPADQVTRYTGQLKELSPGVRIVDMAHQYGAARRPVRADAQLTQPFHAD